MSSTPGDQQIENCERNTVLEKETESNTYLCGLSVHVAEVRCVVEQENVSLQITPPPRNEQAQVVKCTMERLRSWTLMEASTSMLEDDTQYK
jgi:hypothetical protein